MSSNSCIWRNGTQDEVILYEVAWLKGGGLKSNLSFYIAFAMGLGPVLLG